MSSMMRDLVTVQGNFKPSVQLPDDFLDKEDNRHFVESYIPNQETLEVFKSVCDSLQANATKRARIFTGTYGTGKSDLMLMLANYVTRSSDDPLLAPFFERMRLLDNARTESIYQARLNRPPYLLIILQADNAITFSSFVLNGLSRSLEEENIKHLLGQTYYQAALDLIESWESEHPHNIEQIQDVLEKNHGRTLTVLKTDLKGPRADSALEVFRSAVQQAIGIPFAPNAVIERPSDAFKDVARQLVETKNYSGIFVIADEFTHLLQKLADSATAADSKAIDNLAEVAERSKQNQIHFYTVSLQSFASAHGSTELAQNALERSGGRFDEYSLKSQNTEELISGAIGKLVPLDKFYRGAEAQFDDLLTLAMDLWSSQTTGKTDRNWVANTVVLGCFPLHPLTTFCLPRLNAILAQNERTMFSFIWDRQLGLNRFITEAKGDPEEGRISLLTLDRLFDYFEASLREKRPELLLAYQDAGRKLSPEQFEHGLDGQLLRAMVMLEVSNQRADINILRHSIGFSNLQIPEVKSALNALEQAGVAYPSLAGYYQLVKRGGVDPMSLRRLIEQQAQGIHRPLEILNAQYPPNSVEAKEYNTKRGTSRQLTAQFIGLPGLASPATLVPILRQTEALLWYVVTNSEQELEQAKSLTLQLTRQYPELVVAIPHNPTAFTVLLQRKHALEALRESPDYKTTDYQDLLNDVGMIGKDYITQFQLVQQSFDQPRNFEWYRGGRTVTVTTPAHLTSLASTVMENIFPDTPSHKTSQHLKLGKSTKYVRDAIDNILTAPFNLVTKRKSGHIAVLLDGAGELGLIYHTNSSNGYDTYNVCVPEQRQKHSNKVWLQIDEQLRKGIVWADIVNALLAKPYGLYPSVLQVFLAVFYHYNQDYLEIYDSTGTAKKPLDVTADTIAKVVENPEKFVFQYNPLQETQRKFLRGLVERALYPGRPLNIQKGETASLRNRVAKLLRVWGDTISITVRRASYEELASVQDAPTEILAAATTLMQSCTWPEEAMTAVTLLDELPTQLGLDSDCAQWSDDELDQAITYLEGACRYLTGFKKSFKEHMAREVGKIFGLIESSKNWDDTLKAALQWRHRLAGNVQATHLAGAPGSRDLLFVLDDSPRDFQQVFLIALPYRWQMKLFEQWEAIQIRDEYLQRLKDAKEIIDAKAVELGPIDIKTEGVVQTNPDSNESAEDKPIIQPPGPQPDNVSSQAASDAIQVSSIPTLSGITKPESSMHTPKSFKANAAQTEDKGKIDFSVDQALHQIIQIIEQLSPKDQYLLWEHLQDRYDPQ